MKKTKKVVAFLIALAIVIGSSNWFIDHKLRASETDGDTTAQEQQDIAKSADTVIEIVMPSKEDTIAVEPVKEEVPAVEPVKEETPAVEPVKEETPGAEPVKEETTVQETVQEEAPEIEPAKEEVHEAETEKEEATEVETVQEENTEEPAENITPVEVPSERSGSEEVKEPEAEAVTEIEETAAVENTATEDTESEVPESAGEAVIEKTENAEPTTDAETENGKEENEETEGIEETAGHTEEVITEHIIIHSIDLKTESRTIGAGETASVLLSIKVDNEDEAVLNNFILEIKQTNSHETVERTTMIGGEVQKGYLNDRGEKFEKEIAFVPFDGENEKASLRITLFEIDEEETVIASTVLTFEKAEESKEGNGEEVPAEPAAEVIEEPVADTSDMSVSENAEEPEEVIPDESAVEIPEDSVEGISDEIAAVNAVETEEEISEEPIEEIPELPEDGIPADDIEAVTEEPIEEISEMASVENSEETNNEATEQPDAQNPAEPEPSSVVIPETTHTPALTHTPVPTHTLEVSEMPEPANGEEEEEIEIPELDEMLLFGVIEYEDDANRYIELYVWYDGYTEGKYLELGQTLNITAVLYGFENDTDITYQWQVSHDDITYTDIEKADKKVYSVVVTEENCNDFYRVIVLSERMS